MKTDKGKIDSKISIEENSFPIKISLEKRDYSINPSKIDKLHGEIWYQFAYTIALLEQGQKLTEEDYKNLSDRIYDRIVSCVGQ